MRRVSRFQSFSCITKFKMAVVCVRNKTLFIFRLGLSTLNRGFSDTIIDMPERTPPIPQYRPRNNEPTKLKRARLIYQSRKRGMLENGLLLSAFSDKYLDTMNESQLDEYDNLINRPSNDWDIYYWATGAKTIPDEYNGEIMQLLKDFAKNEKMESRIRQPDLKTK